MEKILDKLEAIVGRWFYLSLFVTILVGCITCAIIERAADKHIYDIPNGACYCPKCGMVMVIDEKGAGE